MTKTNKVLLSFDIEEFDLPREHGQKISLEEGVKISSIGTEKILDLLKSCGVTATFFVTGNFAKLAPELLRRMKREGHEIAAHGVDHFHPQKTDIKEAKKILEKVTGAKIIGWRQPRMQKIDYKELLKNGYRYDSSVNPAFIPGRYNNFDVPRKPFLKAPGILEIPASVATSLRIPLFWLALHLFPLKLYQSLARSALYRDSYFITYFHPWEFTDLSKFDVVPPYIKLNSGEKLERRLKTVILELKKHADFETFSTIALPPVV